MQEEEGLGTANKEGVKNDRLRKAVKKKSRYRRTIKIQPLGHCSNRVKGVGRKVIGEK